MQSTPFRWTRILLDKAQDSIENLADEVIAVTSELSGNPVKNGKEGEARRLLSEINAFSNEVANNIIIPLKTMKDELVVKLEEYPYIQEKEKQFVDLEHTIENTIDTSNKYVEDLIQNYQNRIQEQSDK